MAIGGFTFITGTKYKVNLAIIKEKLDLKWLYKYLFELFKCNLA